MSYKAPRRTELTRQHHFITLMKTRTFISALIFLYICSSVYSWERRAADLSFIGSDNKAVVEPGDFDVMIAGLRERFTLK